ncbi:MAG TPA: CAP domain-containing protein [Thermoleophilaceae bacterium]|nr:CAP domain-containing protein [Thermoleophilaceae bacterium]
MRAAVLVVSAVTLAALLFALLPRDSKSPSDPCGPTEGKPSQIGVAAAGQTILCLLNRQRTDHGLPPLRENGLLSQASLQHSQDMVQRNYFEHTTPDGRTVGDRLLALGYARGTTASSGENIAYGYARESTPAAIVALWMESPGHRADILRRSFTEIGIGIAAGAPVLPGAKQSDSATYTTDFGGVFDPSLPND